MQAQLNPRAGSDLLRRYRERGLWGGLALGAIGGAMVCGPHVHDWSLAASGAVMFGLSTGLGLLGWFFGSLAVGSVAGVGAHDAAEPDGHADGAHHADPGSDAN